MRPLSRKNGAHLAAGAGFSHVGLVWALSADEQGDQYDDG
jgi:hypothetical protein